jgi:hypothetical protein
MTGRAAGYCVGFGMPRNINATFGRGLGAGFGRGPGFRRYGLGYGGRGYRFRFFATGLPAWSRIRAYSSPYQGADPEFEKQVLKNQADALESELEFVKKRLAEFDRSAADD